MQKTISKIKDDIQAPVMFRGTPCICLRKPFFNLHEAVNIIKVNKHLYFVNIIKVNKDIYFVNLIKDNHFKS